MWPRPALRKDLTCAKPVLSPGYLRLVSQLLERSRDDVPVIPLDFDHAVFDRPPTPARLFEVFRQGFIIVRGQVQVFDQRHHLAGAAFRGTMDEGGLPGGREGKTLRGGWLPFPQVAVLGRIHQCIMIDGYT